MKVKTLSGETIEVISEKVYVNGIGGYNGTDTSEVKDVAMVISLLEEDMSGALNSLINIRTSLQNI